MPTQNIEGQRDEIDYIVREKNQVLIEIAPKLDSSGTMHDSSIQRSR